MTFSCQLDRADCLAFHRFRIVGPYLRGGSNVWAFRGFALLALALALVEWHNDHPPMVVGLLLSGVAMLLFPRVYWGIVLGRFRRMVNDPQNANTMGRKAMTLTPEGLHIAEPGVESNVTWANIIRAARTDDHIFLFSSTLQAVVIPRASLEGASFEAVWTQAITYLDDHRERGPRQGPESARPATMQGTPAMIFSYQLEEADWMAFNAHHRQHSKGHGRYRWLARFAVLPIPLFLVILGMVRPPTDWGLVVVFAGVGVICFLFYPRVLDNAALRQAGRAAGDPANLHCLGQKTVTLSPEQMHVQAAGEESTIAWSNVVKVERTDDHIFVYLSTIEAIVIPRASLEDASFDEVWTKVNAYLNGSRGNPDGRGSEWR